ncbi:MAG: CPBP family intramembrane metalloprotease [Treponema sp.]|jgi:membrane protease YdiL (CAAX protease family)|nr:CPBP family intramembrane metalloprotease [Treponema sp.]
MIPHPPEPQIHDHKTLGHPNVTPDMFLEPLILYGILFLPGALHHEPPAELAVFSMSREIIRIAAYSLPALALIWYLQWKSGQSGRVSLPGLQDLFTFLVVFPALILTGICVSRIAALFPEIPEGFKIEAPADAAGFFVVFLSCISTGYLEESYFRYYLEEKIRKCGLGTRAFFLISTVLFSFCHVYEGPWGTMNSILAAMILALAYVRFHGLHGLALAHGFYNIVVYLASGIQTPR